MKKHSLFQMVTISAVSVLTGLIASTSFADQCGELSRGETVQALKVLPVGAQIAFFCQACGDEAPRFDTVQQIKATLIPQTNTFNLTINNNPADVAYIYLRLTDSAYVNVARMVGCPTEGVRAEFLVN